MADLFATPRDLHVLTIRFERSYADNIARKLHLDIWPVSPNIVFSEFKERFERGEAFIFDQRKARVYLETQALPIRTFLEDYFFNVADELGLICDLESSGYKALKRIYFRRGSTID